MSTQRVFSFENPASVFPALTLESDSPGWAVLGLADSWVRSSIAHALQKAGEDLMEVWCDVKVLPSRDKRLTLTIHVAQGLHNGSLYRLRPKSPDIWSVAFPLQDCSQDHLDVSVWSIMRIYQEDHGGSVGRESAAGQTMQTVYTLTVEAEPFAHKGSTIPITPHIAPLEKPRIVMDHQPEKPVVSPAPDRRASVPSQNTGSWPHPFAAIQMGHNGQKDLSARTLWSEYDRLVLYFSPEWWSYLECTPQKTTLWLFAQPNTRTVCVSVRKEDCPEGFTVISHATFRVRSEPQADNVASLRPEHRGFSVFSFWPYTAYQTPRDPARRDQRCESFRHRPDGLLEITLPPHFFIIPDALVRDQEEDASVMETVPALPSEPQKATPRLAVMESQPSPPHHEGDIALALGAARFTLAFILDIHNETIRALCPQVMSAHELADHLAAFCWTRPEPVWTRCNEVMRTILESWLREAVTRLIEQSRSSL